MKLAIVLALVILTGCTAHQRHVFGEGVRSWRRPADITCRADGDYTYCNQRRPFIRRY